MRMQIVHPSVDIAQQALTIHIKSFKGSELAPTGLFLHRVNNHIFFADVTDEEVMRGYVLVEDRQPFWWIWEMAVAPEFRKQHVGSGLLDTVIEAAQGVGEHGIELTVKADNTDAWTLYNRKNFQDIRRLRNYYMGSDGILMRRDI